MYDLESVLIVTIVMTLGLVCFSILGVIYIALMSKLYDYITR
jgi:hypothetical protein